MPECREFAPIEDLTDELSEHVLAVNLKGLYTIIRASVPHVKRRGGGAIVTMSSEAESRVNPTLRRTVRVRRRSQPHPGARTRLIPHGIRVNCFAPTS